MAKKDPFKKKPGSLEGWNKERWLKGNWKGIREIVKYGVSYFLTSFLGAYPGVHLAITQFVKSGMDILEYALKEKELL